MTFLGSTLSCSQGCRRRPMSDGRWLACKFLLFFSNLSAIDLEIFYFLICSLTRLWIFIIYLNYETFSNQVLALEGKSGPEPELSSTNLVVCLKGNVPTYHVIEEDSQTPDCSFFPIIPIRPDPLWRGIDPSPYQIHKETN